MEVQRCTNRRVWGAMVSREGGGRWRRGLAAEVGGELRCRGEQKRRGVERGWRHTCEQ